MFELKAATDARRQQLWQNVNTLGAAFDAQLSGPIIPILVEDEISVLRHAERLLEMEIHVGAIRPPTVPKGTSRLRIALSAAHDDSDIAKLAHGLKAVGLRPNGSEKPLTSAD